MKIPGVHTTKLDDRSKNAVYLGSELGTKARRLYDPRNGAILVSTDVVFDEAKSWPWYSQLQCNTYVHIYSTFSLFGMETEIEFINTANNSGGCTLQFTPLHTTVSSTGSLGSFQRTLGILKMVVI